MVKTSFGPKLKLGFQGAAKPMNWTQTSIIPNGLIPDMQKLKLMSSPLCNYGTKGISALADP